MPARKSSERYVSPVWSRATSIVAERAEGAVVHGQDGNSYLDFTSGIGVTNTGHCHPKVVRAVQKQAARLLHGQVNIVYHPPLLEWSRSCARSCRRNWTAFSSPTAAPRR